ncbi:MAG: hypothetical protein OXI50_16305 [Gammaproteobacteria bacterium]|nr:hypothetical protein [Gammaproteobacteria bacterium]
MSVPARADLDALADKINEAMGRAEASYLDTLDAILEAGAAASKAKALLKGERGAFGRWLEENCSVSARQMRKWRMAARSGATAEQIAEAGGLDAFVQIIAKRKSLPFSTERRARNPNPDKPRSAVARLRQELEEERLKVEGLQHNADEKMATEMLHLRQDNERLASLENQVVTLRGQNEGLRAKLTRFRAALRKLNPNHALLRERGATEAKLPSRAPARGEGEPRGGTTGGGPERVGQARQHESEAGATDAPARDGQGSLPGFRSNPTPYDGGL